MQKIIEIENNKNEAIEAVIAALMEMKAGQVLALTMRFYEIVSNIAAEKYFTSLSKHTISKVMNGQRVGLTYNNYLILLKSVREALKIVAKDSREASNQLVLKKIIAQPEAVAA